MMFFLFSLIFVIGFIVVNMPPPSEIFEEDPPPVFGLIVYVFANSLLFFCFLLAVEGILE